MNKNTNPNGKNSNERRIVAYVRVTTREVSRQELSIKGQEETITKYCKEHGLKLDRIYTDFPWSKSISDRPGLKKLLDLVADGAVSTVIVMDLKNLAHNYVERAMITKFIEFHDAHTLSLASLEFGGESLIPQAVIDLILGAEGSAHKGN